MNYFRTSVKVETKSDQSPVTIADKKVEEMLRKRIMRSFPDHGIIGEEFGSEEDHREWVWTIDPIDGTRSFIRGLPLFSTLVSLLHHGKPVLGIISLPALGETAWAIKNQGAWLKEERLHVSKHSKIQGAALATGDVYCFREKKRMRLLNQLHREAGLVRTYPDAFGHLMAIRGIVDAMVDPWAYIWDFAPCKVMAEEAGGTFINMGGTGNDVNLRQGSALVGNKTLVKKLNQLI
ncbi:MAG: hypothetical protein G3M70_15155 [Candidatus Nitronauta litoralis]|uniref:Histidinol-phosphatase n=1 Tax=Candidatus Nitronauta litoralis TaxID=2705533 RepID=A0A7T0BZM2_9BACT|nr:MAG: hypothetical protein G3M70_15155 [Candidatus Nitronauta litoralis]